MTYDLSELKRALERRGLQVINETVDGTFGDLLHLLDVDRGIHSSAKIAQSFTEDSVFHWPLQRHENLAPLIDEIYIHSKLSIFLTVDRRVSMGRFIHGEDFVHDPECFERKKAYAKGILSGLSYLHDDNLCLMNLSDENIVISQSDRAVISDFSCLISLWGTTKPTFNVPIHCRAPEADKDDFDAKAAEMWVAGVLMMDLFLAHMIPWPDVDFEPSKVVQLVDELPFKLLLSVNVGSVITETVFEKYKSFLKCFFRENPVTRVTARNASIASFLSPELKNRCVQQKPAKTVSKENSDRIQQPQSSNEDEMPELMLETEPNSRGKLFKLFKRQKKHLPAKSGETEQLSEVRPKKKSFFCGLRPGFLSKKV